jgi:hypothetical protein
MKEQIKELRVKVDGLAQLTKELKPIKDWKDGANGLFESFDNSIEIGKAVDSLYLGKAWLGKVMGELGNENPYGSGYKTKEDIVPTQDVCFPRAEILTNGFEVADYENKNHIEKVDWLRTEIDQIVKHIKVTNWNVENGSMNELHFDLVYKYLSEARFWLGFELSRVREEI